MIGFLIYESTSGRILRTGYCPAMADVLNQKQNSNETSVKVVDWSSYSQETHYFDRKNGRIASRPDPGITLSTHSVAADGAETATLSNVPAGARVIVSGPVSDSFDADGTDIELTADLPGRYAITIQLFPYQDWEGFFDAT